MTKNNPIKMKSGGMPSRPVRHFPIGESMTRQSFSDETDINKIMARYEKTGLIEHVNTHQGTYGDFSEISDYETALSHVLQAQDNFNSLPSKIRQSFGNDPGQFLSFIQDPDNHDEAKQMGLLPQENPPGEEIEAPTGRETGEAAKPVQGESELPRGE